MDGAAIRYSFGDSIRNADIRADTFRFAHAARASNEPLQRACTSPRLIFSIPSLIHSSRSRLPRKAFRSAEFSIQNHAFDARAVLLSLSAEQGARANAGTCPRCRMSFLRSTLP